VLDVVGGRGGSAEVHRGLPVGSRVQISTPRNTVPLASASEYRLIAGGIGITPILTMAVQLAWLGAPIRLLYAGRSRSRMALLDEVQH
jgi:tetrachlorobenzoquinone reductase